MMMTPLQRRSLQTGGTQQRGASSSKTLLRYSFLHVQQGGTCHTLAKEAPVLNPMQDACCFQQPCEQCMLPGCSLTGTGLGRRG